MNHLNIVDVQKKIDSGVITGGMIPKIQSAVQTVKSGVDQVIIGDNLTDGYNNQGVNDDKIIFKL